jgi:hypothetical protein
MSRIIPPIPQARVAGWIVETDEHGYALYTHEEFPGVILMNLFTGNSEVFLSPAPIENPQIRECNHREAIFSEEGHGNGEEALERCLLMVEAIFPGLWTLPKVRLFSAEKLVASFFYGFIDNECELCCDLQTFPDIVSTLGEYAKEMGVKVLEVNEFWDRVHFILGKDLNFNCFTRDFITWLTHRYPGIVARSA